MTNKKLFELAGVKKVGKKYSCKTLDFGACRTQNCDICDKAQDKNYPPFTEFKQLELIKWIGTLDDWKLSCLHQNTAKTEWWCEVENFDYNFYRSIHKDFSQALAGLVCELWEDLTDEQKTEIKRILE